MVSSEKFAAQENLLHLVKIFCTQKPVKINIPILSESSNPELTLMDISWFLGISEMNYHTYEEIDWTSDDLIENVDEIQRALYRLSKNNELNNKEFEYTYEELKHHILHTLISPKEAIMYVNSIELKNRLANRQNEIEISQRGLRRLIKHRLAEMNLTSELLRNLRSCCKNTPVTLEPNQLPERIWLKILANYLAISSRNYQDYGDIDYDDKNL